MMEAIQNAGRGSLRVNTGVGRRKPDLTPHPDALLIAAAPDLLSVVRRVVADAEAGNCLNMEWLDDARAALASAGL